MGALVLCDAFFGCLRIFSVSDKLVRLVWLYPVSLAAMDLSLARARGAPVCKRGRAVRAAGRAVVSGFVSFAPDRGLVSDLQRRHAPRQYRLCKTHGHFGVLSLGRGMVALHETAGRQPLVERGKRGV